MALSELLMVMISDSSHDALVKDKKSVGGYVYKSYWNLSVKMSDMADNVIVRLRALQLAISTATVPVLNIMLQINVTLSACLKVAISSGSPIDRELSRLVNSAQTAARRFADCMDWQQCLLYAESYAASLRCDRDHASELKVNHSQLNTTIQYATY